MLMMGGITIQTTDELPIQLSNRTLFVLIVILFCCLYLWWLEGAISTKQCEVDRRCANGNVLFRCSKSAKQGDWFYAGGESGMRNASC